MGATLTGVPLYRACGYPNVALENLEVPLATGEVLSIMRMEKRDSRAHIKQALRSEALTRRSRNQTG